MLMTVLKVLYVVVAILMTAFILLQRGAGAQQGGGFGTGASATVFGASGSANFLSKSTKWLAALFFGLSITMAAIISHGTKISTTTAVDAGVMSNFSETPDVLAPVAQPAESEVPSAAGDTTVVPAADATAVPAVDESGSDAKAVEASSAPPAADVAPVTPATAPAQVQPIAADADKPEEKSDN
jgi:preprotein translocase subunit SecG